MNPTDAYRKELRKKELKRVTPSFDFFMLQLICFTIWLLLIIVFIVIESCWPVNALI